jgi:hypothetical protein
VWCVIRHVCDVSRVTCFQTWATFILCRIWGSHSGGYEELCFPLAFTLVSCSAYSSTLKIEGTYTSETSVDTQRTILRYFPKDSTLLLYYLVVGLIYFYLLNWPLALCRLFLIRICHPCPEHCVCLVTKIGLTRSDRGYILCPAILLLREVWISLQLEEWTLREEFVYFLYHITWIRCEIS